MEARDYNSASGSAHKQQYGNEQMQKYGSAAEIRRLNAERQAEGSMQKRKKSARVHEARVNKGE